MKGLIVSSVISSVIGLVITALHRSWNTVPMEKAPIPTTDTTSAPVVASQEKTRYILGTGLTALVGGALYLGLGASKKVILEYMKSDGILPIITLSGGLIIAGVSIVAGEALDKYLKQGIDASLGMLVDNKADLYKKAKHVISGAIQIGAVGAVTVAAGGILGRYSR